MRFQVKSFFSKKNVPTLLFLLVILLIIYYVYTTYFKEGFESLDLDEETKSGKQLVLFYADWCGHCKKAAPEFSKLLSASPITLKDGTKATVKILDGDKDKAEVAKYNVKGFPSVLVIDGGQTTEYPGERTASGIIDFLNSNY